jgi:uncharacterized hydrophobic protein (TIGR00341 family)
MGGGLALTHSGGFDVIPQELLSRTDVRLTDIALALAAGTAGALAFTSGVHTPLVGVMVAVALLPPLVATGIFVGLQQWPASASAALLFLTNLICVNVAAVGTFLAFGIHPRTWWEADRARRAARQALVVWIALLVLLAGIILVAQRS